MKALNAVVVCKERPIQAYVVLNNSTYVIKSRFANLKVPYLGGHWQKFQTSGGGGGGD